MDTLLSYFIIPGLTLLLPGETNWFTSNFSVAGAYFPQNILLIVWAIVIARFYHTFTKRTIGQTRSFLNAEKELVLTDVSACLLVGCVFLPYRPQTSPFFFFSSPGHGIYRNRGVLSLHHSNGCEAVQPGAGSVFLSDSPAGICHRMHLCPAHPLRLSDLKRTGDLSNNIFLCMAEAV